MHPLPIAPLLAAVLAILMSSARAQEVPAATDQTFWCAAAYGVASVFAGEDGQAEVAATLLGYSETLAVAGKQTLAAQGMETAAGDAIALGYFDEVLAQFGGEGEPRFTVGQCETILRPLLAL
ncbi:MAG: hypothetical protein WEB63_05910 [Cucumibacter sp.]